MKYNFKPKSKLEKFGFFICNLLVENFSQTFYVGGMVRDLLLQKKVTDIDIATEATPDEVISLLNNHGIKTESAHKKFGNVLAKQGGLTVEITSLRKDLYSANRFPEVAFIKSAKIDSKRRDFTINSLYLSAKSGVLLDYYDGLLDLKNKIIKFIGKPSDRIKQDPLRIVRALRFAQMLNFKLDKNTKKSILNNLDLVQNLTETKISKEIFKVKTNFGRKKIQIALDDKKMLDKYFK